MNTHERDEVLKYHRLKTTKLMEITRVASDTSYEVIDEATVHLIEHFDPPHTRAAREDHVMIIGSAHFGQSVENPELGVKAECMFMCGDTHALSHTLAEYMHQDNVLARVIFHAMEVFSLHDRKPSNDL